MGQHNVYDASGLKGHIQLNSDNCKKYKSVGI